MTSGATPMHRDAQRVVMLIQGYAPLVGGAERVVGAIAPSLRREGVDVAVITRRYRGLPAYEMIDGVPVYRLPIPGPKPVAAVSYTMTALPLLRRLRPHVIHAHELLSPATTAVAAKRLLGTAVIAMPHRGGALGDIARLREKALGGRRIATLRQRVDTFIAISQEIDDELAAIGIPPARRVYIPNGIDIERFAPAESGSRAGLRASLGLPDAPIAIFTGRLAPEKRIDQLLRIWPTVREEHPDAHLLVVGTGSQVAELRRAAGPGVRFAGVVDDVAPYLQASDLFVLPSIAEGLSVALLEAMAVGLPCLVTAVGGATDVIEHGQSGWLVPPDEPAALLAGLLGLLNDEERRHRLGRQARERVVGDFALAATVQQHRDLYDRFAPRNSPSDERRLPLPA